MQPGFPLFLRIPLEIGDLSGLVVLILLIMMGPALVLFMIGLIVRKSNKKAAKVLFILAGVYLLISLGICGGLMGGF
ncbi:hypothetical protein FK220_006370 [Flavobacteriaceae bacterium TP-CH-4]|uniref:Uncharacterized protein n=1 Tax=Pelagihabitans pacificus TaxID=2696054 RepID=A0A967ARB8_9FLAO|nr:hypothetical protein [Pelagihabitans pacificus]NHF58956.1 hypothetical protein [Pelagihabitans pacificus]